MKESDKDRKELANQLRDFADRVEDGELTVVEIAIRSGDTPRVTVEGMNSDELHRVHALLD